MIALKLASAESLAVTLAAAKASFCCARCTAAVSTNLDCSTLRSSIVNVSSILLSSRMARTSAWPPLLSAFNVFRSLSCLPAAISPANLAIATASLALPITLLVASSSTRAAFSEFAVTFCRLRSAATAMIAVVYNSSVKVER